MVRSVFSSYEFYPALSILESASPPAPKRKRARDPNRKRTRDPKTHPIRKSPSVEETQVHYLTATKIRLILQHLSLLLVFFTILRSSIALWTAVYLTGRTFGWLPFSFEAIMNLLCAAIGAGIFGERSSRSKLAAGFLVLWLFALQFCLNVALFSWLGPLFGEAFFEEEPGAPLNDSWAWLYQLLIVYFVLSVFGFILNWAVRCVSCSFLCNCSLWPRFVF